MGRKTTNDNKERICIFIDKKTIAHFKHVASQTEVAYTLLVNKALSEYIASLPPEQQYHNR